MSAVRRWVDPFIVLLLGCMLLGVFRPVSGGAARTLDTITTIAIGLLFFVYGMRISTTEAIAGLKNWRLHSTILAATYLLFPILGLALQPLLRPALGPLLASGLLYLTLLPSTVQSSVAFTSIARGNVAAAICAASLSNIVGMVLTPVMVGLLLGTTGVHLTWTSLGAVLLQLLVPFIAGQLLQPKVGDVVRRQKWMSAITDRGVILLVVYAAFSEGMSQHIWTGVSVGTILLLIVVCAALLAVVLAATWRAGSWLHFDRGERIALLMCGSKKSLATGAPMASILFASVPGMAAAVTLPVMVFHQIQLIVCAVIARRLGRTSPHLPAAQPTR